IRTYRVMLTLCAFSGVVSCFLTPFYLYRLVKEPSRHAKIFAGILLAGCAVQGVAVLWTYFFGVMVGHVPRNSALSLSTLLPVYAKETLGMLFVEYEKLGEIPWQSAWVWPLATAAYACLFALMASGLPLRARILFAGSSLTLSLLSLLTGLEGPIKGRYYFAPNVIFMLMVMQNALMGDAIRRTVAIFMLAVATGISIQAYYAEYRCYDPAWPVWENEVRLWRESPGRRILMHPEKPFWTMYLLPRPSGAPQP
ncbi:MAG: hypothetical protein K2Q01_06725, partial [Rickettsiales bacterium]|nr:hypothetical protein [Rickettsiales bacterium]